MPEASLNVLNSFYMDENLASSPKVEEETLKVENLLKLLFLGVFKLTMFVSNVASFPPQLQVNPTRSFEANDIPNVEVLFC